MSAPRWGEVIALFGGRFDPPHRGHLESVRGLFSEPGAREVWILPSPTPPHKPAQAPAADRLEMVRLCFNRANLGLLADSIRIDEREMAHARSHPGLPTYTIDTLREVRREVRDLAFVIGADQLALFHTWNRFPELLGLCHWIVTCRKPGGEDLARETLRHWESGALIRSQGETGLWRVGGESGTCLKLVQTPAPELSSTQIREEIARSGNPPSESLSPEVNQYLKRQRLYGSVAANE